MSTADAWTQGQWWPFNFAQLSSFVAKHHSAAHTAVFDFDNTTITGDIGEAVFYYQLDQGLVRLPPAALADLLMPFDGVPGAQPLVLAACSAWDKMQTTPARHSSHHRIFRFAMASLYECLTASHQSQQTIARAYFLLAQLWAGFSSSDVAGHTQHAIALAQRSDAKAQCWEKPPELTVEAPAHHFDPKIIKEPHMTALIAHLAARGITPYVVSASFEPLVRCVSADLGLAFAPQNIIGLRVNTNHDGRFTTAAIPDHPITYRQGKVLAIARYLPRSPKLVAGDAITDWDMLTQESDLALRLVIYRNSSAPQMQALYKEAEQISCGHQDPKNADEFSVRPMTLLQGRDPETGLFVPHQRS